MYMYYDIEINGDTDTKEAMQLLLGGPVGYTVARTARILDMTRQSVAEAIQKDRLHATRLYVVTKKGRKLLSTEVDRESVARYAEAKMGRDRVPYGYKDTQLSIFSQ